MSFFPPPDLTQKELEHKEKELGAERGTGRSLGNGLEEMLKESQRWCHPWCCSWGFPKEPPPAPALLLPPPLAGLCPSPASLGFPTHPRSVSDSSEVFSGHSLS